MKLQDVEIELARTEELDEATLAAARAMLEEVFEGDLSEEDWQHGLGGLHALAWEDGELVGHASVVPRQLEHGGRTLRTGYVEGVGVRADRQRQGIGGALMQPLEEYVRANFELGGLGATDAGAALYRGRGWRRWEGPTSVRAPDGVRRTPEEDGCIYVLPGAGTELDLAGELTCEWRDGDAW